MLLDFSTFTSFSNITNVGTSTCSCNVRHTTEGLLETYLEKKRRVPLFYTVNKFKGENYFIHYHMLFILSIKSYL